MSLENISIKELNLRKSILQTIINENQDDPRVDEPKRQLAIIETEIQSRSNKNVIVSLDALNIAAAKE